jgi:magnesium chelatase family protein
MSVRSYHRTLRVARTIADLEGGDALGLAHIAEALQLKRAVE